MIGILVERYEHFTRWCRENGIIPNSKDFVPIRRLTDALGIKFDEAWRVEGLPMCVDEFVEILEYLASHRTKIRSVPEILRKECNE